MIFFSPSFSPPLKYDDLVKSQKAPFYEAGEESPPPSFEVNPNGFTPTPSRGLPALGLLMTSYEAIKYGFSPKNYLYVEMDIQGLYHRSERCKARVSEKKAATLCGRPIGGL